MSRRARGVAERTVDVRDLGARQLGFAEERGACVLRREDLRVECRTRRSTTRQPVSAALGRSDSEHPGAEVHGPRRRGREATRRNRIRGIGGLVLHEQTIESERATQPARSNQRCPALAERHRLIETFLAFEERQDLAVSPQ